MGGEGGNGLFSLSTVYRSILWRSNKPTTEHTGGLIEISDYCLLAYCHGAGRIEGGNMVRLMVIDTRTDKIHSEQGFANYNNQII